MMIVRDIEGIVKGIALGKMMDMTVGRLARIAKSSLSLAWDLDMALERIGAGTGDGADCWGQLAIF